MVEEGPFEEELETCEQAEDCVCPACCAYRVVNRHAQFGLGPAEMVTMLAVAVAVVISNTAAPKDHLKALHLFTEHVNQMMTDPVEDKEKLH